MRNIGNTLLALVCLSIGCAGSALAKVDTKGSTSAPVAAVSTATPSSPVEHAHPQAGAATDATPPKPESPAAAAKLDLLDQSLIHTATVIAAVLGLIVALFPITAFIHKGWGWRYHIICASLGTLAKDAYLYLFHKEDYDKDSADRRFETYYRRWYGRSRLIIPTLILGVIVALYAYLLALFAAQQLFHATLAIFSESITYIAASAIAGGYTIVTFDAISRVTRRELSPEDLYQYALRLMVAVPVGYAVAAWAKEPIGPPLAFAVAAFPLQQLIAMLQRLASSQLGQKLPEEAVSDLTTKLSGVDAAIYERISNIGITTVPQLAYSDPLQLTMRTSLGLTFVLDLVSQALAFIYLDDKLQTLRPMGLRGAYELAVLWREVREPDNPNHTNSLAVLTQAATAIGLSEEQLRNALHEIADDPYVDFLLYAYGG